MVLETTLLEIQEIEDRVAREREALDLPAERLGQAPLWRWTKRAMGFAPPASKIAGFFTNRLVWSGAFWLLQKSLNRFTTRRRN